MKESVEHRAVHIAAVVLVAAGICRYESATQCPKVVPFEEEDCAKCLKRWLIRKARAELKEEKGK